MVCEKKKKVIPPGFKRCYMYGNGGLFTIEIASAGGKGHFICEECQEAMHKAITDSKCLRRKNLFPKKN